MIEGMISRSQNYVMQKCTALWKFFKMDKISTHFRPIFLPHQKRIYKTFKNSVKIAKKILTLRIFSEFPSFFPYLRYFLQYLRNFSTSLLYHISIGVSVCETHRPLLGVRDISLTGHCSNGTFLQ